MESNLLHQQFVKTIKERVPQKELVNMLADLLIIEKEAVYRRLRGEVPFTFAETVKISKKLNISLDMVVGTASYNDKPFSLNLTDHYRHTEADYKSIERLISTIEFAGKSKYSEFGFTTGVLPLHSSCVYENIERFYVLRWLYQFNHSERVIPYKQIKLSERKKSLNQQFIEVVQDIKYTHFVWDRLTLFYLINDIHYFHQIHLIDDEDLMTLKAEIELFLSDLEDIAIKGSHANGNKVEMYISNLNLETVYTYLQADELNVTFVKTFTLDEIVSTDSLVFQRIKASTDTLKRASVLISGSNEIYRIQYFEKQRKLVENMFDKNYTFSLL